MDFKSLPLTEISLHIEAHVDGAVDKPRPESAALLKCMAKQDPLPPMTCFQMQAFWRLICFPVTVLKTEDDDDGDNDGDNDGDDDDNVALLDNSDAEDEEGPKPLEIICLPPFSWDEPEEFIGAMSDGLVERLQNVVRNQ
jgi:hypothetical protein